VPDELPSRGPVVGDDGVVRCRWAAGNAAHRHYHDTEWGVPVRGERALFERISLEGFQAGLSWLTILNKRPAFRAAFREFDPDTVAAFTDADVARLLDDAGIVRHRQKIEAVRTNARATIVLRDDGGLDALVWSFRPRTTPVPHESGDAPTVSAESTALSKALRRRGFAFVGPTTMHALIEAVGLLDTHLVGCHRRGVSGLWTEEGTAKGG
jgi:DNA-3-methyladenine glycosylase I